MFSLYKRKNQSFVSSIKAKKNDGCQLKIIFKTFFIYYFLLIQLIILLLYLFLIMKFSNK